LSGCGLIDTEQVLEQRAEHELEAEFIFAMDRFDPFPQQTAEAFNRVEFLE
jgi:hypothetical protein